MKYAVITDNEVRKSGYVYNNLVGSHYTFPHKYKSWISEGTRVVYYKSKQLSSDHSATRLTKAAHYFGIAVIDKVYLLGKEGNNNMYVATIKDYVPFVSPVPFNKPGGGHFENDTTDWDIQKWRNGVRDITKEIFDSIVDEAGLPNGVATDDQIVQEESPDQEYTSVDMNVSEGTPIRVYTTRFERNPIIRDRIIRAKGCKCCVCGIDFEKLYGQLGKGFIHVHHNKPLYTGVRFSYNNDDFDVVCPNCHAMLHRVQRTCITVEQLKGMMACKIEIVPLDSD